MIVWGGLGASNYQNTGGIYHPVSNTWTATSTTNAPAAMSGHTAVWTGSRMIVWGAVLGGGLNGGIYDPATDTWTAMSTANAPAGRSHTAVWTGSRMVVWGGVSATQILGTGGIYDPSLVRLLVRKTGSGSGGVRSTYGEIDCSAD